MSNSIEKDTYISSLEEFQLFHSFMKLTQDNSGNWSFKSNPNIIYAGSSKTEEKMENFDFYKKYNYLFTENKALPFYLEDELAKHVKYWHSTNVEFQLPVLSLDNFFNEENVKSRLLKETYVKKNPPIVSYYLIDYLIKNLEEKVFDKVLIEGITSYQEEDHQIGLVGPIIDRDFIYYLINYDIEEKLNYLYKDNSLGYSYIAEQIISFDLFIIYLILKNYPFYILRRERLEEIFNKVKKFKSFPYPIGSIGMDLFKLLIKELYLPGVTLFQEIRETFLLDIIDPKIIEINCDYFIKVIALSSNNTVFGMSYVENENQNQNKNNIINENINVFQENNKIKDKNNIKNKTGTKNDNIKLNEMKDFTLTAYGVYSAFILYANDYQREEKETSYFTDILALFEKRFKLKKDEESSKDNISEKNINPSEKNINISEKNIINNIFNLIDTGLDSNFSSFCNDVKIMNDKLIAKMKEIHETTNNHAKENINIRRFLNPELTFLNYEFKGTNLKKLIHKKINYNEEKAKLNANSKSKKKNKINNYNDIDSKYNKVNNINNITNEENEIEEEDIEMAVLNEKKECFNYIKIYKNILDYENNVSNDLVLDNYVHNFLSLKEKYFWHLQKFETKNVEFDDEEMKRQVFEYNIISEKREKLLPELYNQKYLITEDHLYNFIKQLFLWKSNINPLYHKKLYEEFTKNEKQKNIKKKNQKNSSLKDFDIFEDDFPENDKDFANIPLNSITIIKEQLEKIVESKLYFNNKIYLLPGKIHKSVTRHISRNDYIYKCTIGDLFMNFYEKQPTKDTEEVIKMPLQIYLKEAKHFYDLTVFKAIIETTDDDKSYMKLNLYDYYYLLYGGFHIEVQSGIKMILDNKIIELKVSDNPIYIDIINIYNFEKNVEKNEKQPCNQNKKVNDIEKYLVYPISDKFQIFISPVKENPNHNTENENPNPSLYFQKYIGNLINFDVKSAYYEAKKITLSNGQFTIYPTFIENISIKNCSIFEITIDNIKNKDSEDEEEEENKNELFDDEEEMRKIFELNKTTSFNVKISTFIDLESNND